MHLLLLPLMCSFLLALLLLALLLALWPSLNCLTLMRGGVLLAAVTLWLLRVCWKVVIL
jgi:hypothetical protein